MRPALAARSSAARSGRGGARLAWCCAGLLIGSLAAPAWAGPPFITDDPAPTDPQHWEIYNFVIGEDGPGGSVAQFGEDINYGAARNLQLTMVLPLQAETGVPLGAGDVELAAKYEFRHHTPGTLSLDASFFPRVFLPTARGSSGVQLLLPLWLERDFGKWNLFGGGGYTLNPGVGNRDFWQGGAVLNRLVRPGLQLGLELYAQGSPAVGQRAVTGLNLGTAIHLGGPFSLLGSFGQGLNRHQTVYYTALKLDL